MKTVSPYILFLYIILIVSSAGADDLRDGAIAFDKKDYAVALQKWKPLAERGDANAQYFLGGMYEEGKGVSRDYSESLKWYRLAAAQGLPRGQFALGRMYFKGHGVTQDYKEAAKWYGYAAEQDVDVAQFNLGLMYGKGQGVPQNFKTAAKFYRQAAEQGFADAQNNCMKMEMGSSKTTRKPPNGIRPPPNKVYLLRNS
jgi:TPR repeat protein